MALKDILNPNAKILIADDVCSARRTLRRELSALGFINVIEVRDGSEAYERVLTEDGIGLIISSWKMSDMTSIELMEHLRAEPTLADIPIVVATSRSEWHELAEQTPDGIHGFLAKPFSPGAVEHALKNALTRTALTEAIPPYQPLGNGDGSYLPIV